LPLVFSLWVVPVLILPFFVSYKSTRNYHIENELFRRILIRSNIIFVINIFFRTFNHEIHSFNPVFKDIDICWRTFTVRYGNDMVLK
jgi:hypothetical protein